MLFDVYKNKTILVTGDTGFKGSWLTIWLKLLGAEVYGFSKNIPTNPSNFGASGLDKTSTTEFSDIKDLAKLKSLVMQVQPDYIFHLAAQALVKESYISPTETFLTNAMGSANIIEASRILNKKVNIIMITSDKAYDNVEWKWGYRENDAIGGKDPYSASKGMAELVIRSYFESFIKKEESNIKIGITRAGNVIGGGDWAKDRIIPDCIKSWSDGKTVDIRSPKATRPWQHVLEPLSGYLTLGAYLDQKESINGQAYNFGPESKQDYSVEILINEMNKYWKNVKWNDLSERTQDFHEAGLLKLNCDKAQFDLNWSPTLEFKDTVRYTAEWYKEFYENGNPEMLEFSQNQIREYTQTANKKNIFWARDEREL